MDCQFIPRCKRYWYSKYLLDVGYVGVPPTVFEIVAAGYGDVQILDPGTRMFAEKMPTCGDGGVYLNICPVIEFGDVSACHERNKEERRQSRLDEARKRRGNYSDARQRVNIPREVRVQVAEQCRYHCSYCGRVINSYDSSHKRIRGAVDHIVPLHRGGGDNIDNLTLACQDCNRAKSADIWQFGCRVGYYE